MFLTCGGMEVVGFPAQNAYKMAYGDENITFESRCKRETFEPVNGYYLTSFMTFLKFGDII